MPKAFLMKKKAALAALAAGSPPPPAKAYSPSPSSSGIGSPSSSPPSSSGSFSPRNDENRFDSVTGNYDEKNECLDLSIKSLLKESNLKRSAASSTFVSSYPYPAKFAKIADFLRISTEATSPAGESRHQYALNLSSPPSASITAKQVANCPEDVSYHHHHHHRISPYSINWSEHFSVNEIASPSSASHRSMGSDSSRSESSMDDLSVAPIASPVSTEKVSGGSKQKSAGNKTSDRYHCPDCNKSYSTASGLAKHQEFLCSTQVKKSFSCKHCEKVYYSLGALKMHIRTHTLPCKCTLCGKAFSRPWLLQGHIRTHTGEKPFACQYCNRAFADRSNLRAHLQTHSVVKKYSCKTCSRTFSRMSLLLKHEDNGCNAGEPRPMVPVQG